MSNDFDEFTKLPAELQLEAIREGEKRVEAQLQIATSADQRALTWGGLLVAAVTAALGAGIALATKDKPDYSLAFLAIAFAGCLTWGAWTALSTAKPEQFHVPGNRPAHWLPSAWKFTGSSVANMNRARREQAECLEEAIEHNATASAKKAAKLLRSFDIAKWTMALGGAVLLLILAIRAFEWPAFGVKLLG
jgi:hypothetical protein